MRVALPLLALAASASVGRAQPPVLENATLRLELIGLRRWTVPMIQDSLRAHAPKDSLLSHACAAVLRDQLHFADASVALYPAAFTHAAKDYIAVTVVEPQDSARVRYRAEPRDTAPDVPAWAPVRRVLDTAPIAAQLILQHPDLLRGDRAPAPADSDAAGALGLRDFLRASRGAADRDRALRTLAADGNYQNRAAAVYVLANFAGEDRVWWALADALRDPDGRVHSPAYQLLAGLAKTAPRRVDWAPAADTLRAVLDGTDLFAHTTLMEVLAATGVAPALAPALLRGGGDIVLAKLGATGEQERRAARAFLVAVAGRDLGADPRAWRAWVASL